MEKKHVKILIVGLLSLCIIGSIVTAVVIAVLVKRSTIVDVDPRPNIEDPVDIDDNPTTPAVFKGGYLDSATKSELAINQKKKVVSDINLFTTNYAGIDPDKYYQYYEVGEITDGDFSGSRIILGVLTNDLEEYQNYFYGIFLTSYDSRTPVEIEILEKDGKYTLGGKRFYNVDEGEGSSFFVPNSNVVIDSELDLSKSLANIPIDSTYNEKIFFESIVLLDENSVELKKEYEFEGTKYAIYSDEEDSDNRILYINIFDDFYSQNYLVNPINHGSDGKEKLVWVDSSLDSYQPWFSMDIKGQYILNSVDIVELNESDLELFAVHTSGEKLYRYKEMNKDEYAKKIYTEDYLNNDFAHYKYNLMTEDDVTPFTYEQSYKYAPVAYWKDFMGRWVRMTNQDFVYEGGIAKPVIYLYPPKATDVVVRIDFKGELRRTIPKYNGRWEVKASSGSILTDNDGNKYDYLFWDGMSEINVEDFSTGWCIKKGEIEEFLSRTLPGMGFNQKESGQFKEYWVAKVAEMDSPYVLISYRDEKFLDYLAPISIEPKVDSYKRYLMLFKGVDNPIQIDSPKIEKVNREGFFMFEWGGTVVSD